MVWTPTTDYIISKATSIDTCVMLRRRRLSRQLSDGVMLLSAGVRCYRSNYGRKDQLWHRVTVEEPTPEALDLIEQQTPGELKVQLVDVALDLVCVDAVASSQLCQCLKQHIVQPYGRDRLIDYKGTIYTSRRRWRGQGIRLYRRPAEPRTVRIEWSIKGTERVKRTLGVSRPSQVAEIDHEAFWQHRLRLHRIDPSSMVRRYRRQNGVTERRARRAVGLWLRTLQNEWSSTPTAQDVAVGLKHQSWFDRRVALPRIGVEDLISGLVTQ